MHVWCADWGSLRLLLWWAETRRGSLERCLRHLRLWASRHAWSARVRLVAVLHVLAVLALLM